MQSTLFEASKSGHESADSVLGAERTGMLAWYNALGTLMASQDLAIRLAATHRLPDVITETHQASANLNNGGWLLRALEGMIEEQPPEILVGVAASCGLLAVKNVISDITPSQDSPRRFKTPGYLLGDDPVIPVRAWFYPTNITRGIAVTKALEKHKHKTIRDAAVQSLDYWLVQPLRKF